jgi:acyl-CoA dehydrogenase
MRWSIEHALWKTQNALVEILDNLPMRPAAWLLRLLLFPLGTRAKPPSDRVATEVAVGVLGRGEQRLRHTSDMFTPPEDEPGLGALEKRLEIILDATEPQVRLRAARREGRIKSVAGNEGLQKAVELGVLNEAEADLVRAARKARDAAIQVDAFSQEMFLRIRG